MTPASQPPPPPSAAPPPPAPDATTAAPPPSVSVVKPPRRVQWSSAPPHVSIPISPISPTGTTTTTTTDDESDLEVVHEAIAARSHLPRRASQSPPSSDGSIDPFDDARYRVDDVPLPLIYGDEMEGGEARLEVFVDPLERDGLPSLLQPGEEQQAQGIVAGLTGGKLWEGLRQRRNSIRQLREKEEDEEARDEQQEKMSEKGVQQVDTVKSPSDGAAPDYPMLPGGEGILAALMALQREENALGAHHHHDTPGTSTVNTPTSTAPSSPQLSRDGNGSADLEYHLDEDSEEEIEREKFIARLKKKRASKNALHKTSESVAKGSKSAASAAFRAATGGHFRGASSGSGTGLAGERGRNFTASSCSASSSTLSAVGEERSASRSRASSPSSPASPTSPLHHSGGATSPSIRRPLSSHSAHSASSDNVPSASSPTRTPARSHSSNTLSRLATSLSSPTRSPPVSPVEPGAYVPHRAKLTSEFTKRVRKIGDKLGLETETSSTRPAAARSGAGVFGGLVLGTASLVAPAAPANASLAPLPTRPGYNLSRYSAPDVRPTLPSHRSLSPPPTARTQPPTPASSPPSSGSATPRRTLSPPPKSPAARSFDSASRAASRKSLSDMVREEEEAEEEEIRSGSPTTATSSGGAGFGSAALPLPPPISERRKHKKAVFSLQLNDLPSQTVEDDFRVSPPSSRPSLTISTAALTPSQSRTSPSPTSATFRSFGGNGPKSPLPAAVTPGGTPRKEYFVIPASAAEKEKDRVERKLREERRREAEERERDLREWQKEKKRRRKVREKELKARRVFITAHVAAILERQEFICKLARAFMMFGAPSHRLEAQIQATARVLELPHCTAMYLPNVVLINFADPFTSTCDIKFIKQASGLDFGKLRTAYFVYNKVIRDKLSVHDASSALDDLMTAPPKYALWQHMILGAFASGFITPSGFGGSFIDAVAAGCLAASLVFFGTVFSRNDLYSSLFEIVICTLNAVIAGALSYSDQFCFYSVAAGSIVLILPGYLVLCAALEVANRSIVSGAVRITYSALYALFLGFGLSAGAEIYTMGGREALAGGGDYTCAYLRTDAPWWRQTIPKWWYFLTVPGFLLFMAIKHGQPLFRRDTIAMVVIGGAAFSTNFFAAYAFTNMPALTTCLASFVVGILSNTYARFTRESAFVVAIVGMFVQLPSGLSNGGLISFAQTSATSTTSNFSSAVDAAAGLIRLIIGITIGLYAANAVVNLVSRRGRKRGAHLSTF